MKDITLTELLEAGCHFGHKADRWHPKAATFIYGVREGVHIIDLAKTRSQLLKAVEFVQNLGKEGKTLLMVGTKRQAKGIVSAAAKKAGAFYFVNRWIGGFLTNWDEVKKNVERLNTMRRDRDAGEWKKFPKHEQVKLEKTLRQIEMVYDGVSEIKRVPDALFLVDIKTEQIALKEALRRQITTVAMVDTNSDPTPVDYYIAANDDALGSIQKIVDIISDAYKEGKDAGDKQRAKDAEKAAKPKPEEKAPEPKIEVKPEPLKEEKKPQAEKKTTKKASVKPKKKAKK